MTAVAADCAHRCDLAANRAIEVPVSSARLPYTSRVTGLRCFEMSTDVTNHLNVRVYTAGIGSVSSIQWLQLPPNIADPGGDEVNDHVVDLARKRHAADPFSQDANPVTVVE